MDPLVAKHIEDIRRIARQHGATRIRLIGSRARGEARGDSDVDILVDMEDGRSALDVVAIQLDLQELLGCKVDIGEDVSPYIREQVMREAVEI